MFVTIIFVFYKQILLLERLLWCRQIRESSSLLLLANLRQSRKRLRESIWLLAHHWVFHWLLTEIIIVIWLSIIIRFIPFRFLFLIFRLRACSYWFYVTWWLSRLLLWNWCSSVLIKYILLHWLCSTLILILCIILLIVILVVVLIVLLIVSLIIVCLIVITIVILSLITLIVVVVIVLVSWLVVLILIILLIVLLVVVLIVIILVILIILIIVVVLLLSIVISILLIVIVILIILILGIVLMSLVIARLHKLSRFRFSDSWSNLYRCRNLLRIFFTFVIIKEVDFLCSSFSFLS